MSFSISPTGLSDDQKSRLDALMKDQANQKKLKNNAMDKDAFLRILTTQLQYQDPLSPMDNKDFIAQMAQFSSVEQLNNISESTSGQLQNQEALSKQLETINENLVKLAESNSSGSSTSDDKADETLAAIKELKEVNVQLLNEMIKFNKAKEALE